MPEIILSGITAGQVVTLIGTTSSVAGNTFHFFPDALVYTRLNNLHRSEIQGVPYSCANFSGAESPVQMFSTYTSRLLTPSLLYQERQGWRDVSVAIQRKRRDASYRSSAAGAPKSHLPPACRNE